VLLAAVTLSCAQGDHPEAAHADATEAPPGPAPTWVDMSSQESPRVVARGNRFVPTHIEVRRGAEVSFEGDAGHDVVFTDGLTAPVTRDDFARQAVQVRRFDAPGDHPFHCSLHGIPGKGMHGVVRVRE
jgi:plastocyanin